MTLRPSEGCEGSALDSKTLLEAGIILLMETCEHVGNLIGLDPESRRALHAILSTALARSRT